MTKKDFVLIAKTLNENEASNEMILAFCAALRPTNPVFDELRFLAECRKK